MHIWKDSKSRYGAPKIHKILSGAGKQISLKRVQRYMKELGIHSIVIKKFRYHTSKTSPGERKNILNRDFKTTGINQKWCTDITYIHTLKDGWTYLASVMDFYSRKIIGYAYGTSMTTELALKAVENACIESFHSVLKKEEINHHKYYDFKIASKAIFDYIESWYDRKRIHSAINYMTPQAAHEAA